MNKTVNINIGGLFFHIDEDAYQKLHDYFEAIKRSLSNSSGQEEIMKDIEMRVAELLTERQKTDKHVINIQDIEVVIAIMGQPEDYRIDDGGTETAIPSYTHKRKKLYRDQDGGTIAGVCTGLGHYFGIDAVWIKLVFLFFTFFGGSGLIAYLIFWIATPKAVTTSEKLEMTGEPVTISNIERKVREEFENVSNKIKNVNYDELGNKVRSGAAGAGNKLGDFLEIVFAAIAKVLGIIITAFTSIALIGICIGSILLLFSTALPENIIIKQFSTPIGLETPLWVHGVLFLFAFGIPMFFLLLLGLKLVIPNFKSIGNIAKYSLLAIWIITVGIAISLGLREASQLAFDSKDVKKENIKMVATDTLFVKFKNNDFYSKKDDADDNFRLTQDENNNEIIYSNNITIEVLRTDEAVPYLQVEKLASGKSAVEAKRRAEKIRYNYEIAKNQLILDNYLVSDVADKFRNQRVKLFLYVPKETVFKMDSTAKTFDVSDEDFFNPNYDFSDAVYKVGDSQAKCLNCPNDNNGEDSVKTVSIKINGKTVLETKTEENAKSSDDSASIVIKTK